MERGDFVREAPWSVVPTDAADGIGAQKKVMRTEWVRVCARADRVRR